MFCMWCVLAMTGFFLNKISVNIELSTIGQVSFSFVFVFLFLLLLNGGCELILERRKQIHDFCLIFVVLCAIFSPVFCEMFILFFVVVLLKLGLF